MVYDVPKNYIGDTYHNNPDGLEDGDELELERGGVLVQVAERVATEETDVSALVTRRTPKGIDQGEGQPARMPTQLQPRSMSLGISQKTPRKWTGWTGRAQIPQESPFQQKKLVQRETENDWEQGPAAKRRRQEDDEHVPLYQILKTSRPGIRSALNSSPAVSSPLSASTANARITSRMNTTSNATKKKTALPAGQARFQVKEVIDIASSPEEGGLPRPAKSQPQTTQRSHAPSKINVVQAKLSQTVNGRSLGPLRPEVVRAFKPPGSQLSQAAGPHEEERGGVYNSSSPARPETVKKPRAPVPTKSNVVQAKLAQSEGGRQLGSVRPELVRTFRAPTSQPQELAEKTARAPETPSRRPEDVLPTKLPQVSDEEEAEPVPQKMKPATNPRRLAIETVTPQKLPPSSPRVSTKNHLQPTSKTLNIDLTEDDTEGITAPVEPKRPMKALKLGGISRPKMLLFQQAPKSRPATPVEIPKTTKEDHAVTSKTKPVENVNTELSVLVDPADSSPAFGTMDASRPTRNVQQSKTKSHLSKQSIFIQDDSDDDDDEDAFETMVVSPAKVTPLPNIDIPSIVHDEEDELGMAEAPAPALERVNTKIARPMVEFLTARSKSPSPIQQGPTKDVLSARSVPASIVKPPIPSTALDSIPKTADIHGPHPDIDNLMKPTVTATTESATSLTSKQPQTKLAVKPTKDPLLAKPHGTTKTKAPSRQPSPGPQPQPTTAKPNTAITLPKLPNKPMQNAQPPKEQFTVPPHSNSDTTNIDLLPPPSTAPTEPSPQKRSSKKPLTRATTISNPARASKEQQKVQEHQTAHAQPSVVVDEVVFAREKRLADEKKSTGPWTKEAWDLFGWCPPGKKEGLGWGYGDGGGQVGVLREDAGPANDGVMLGERSGRMDQVRALGGFGRVGRDGVIA